MWIDNGTIDKHCAYYGLLIFDVIQDPQVKMDSQVDQEDPANQAKMDNQVDQAHQAKMVTQVSNLKPFLDFFSSIA